MGQHVFVFVGLSGHQNLSLVVEKQVWKKGMNPKPTL